ncbi:MAG: PAS domain S-box protein [Myxococcaceae bacterium]|nr:PAS domain S-box protein [Myxococcaceae bacterium]
MTDGAGAAPTSAVLRQGLEAILACLPVPLVLVEPGTARITFVNQAVEALWGGPLPSVSSVEDNARAFVMTDGEGRVLAAEELPTVRASRGETLADLYVSLETPRGRVALRVDVAQVPSVGALPAMAVVTCRDSTSLREAQLAMEVHEHDYRALAESMPQVVWTARPDGHLDFINQVIAHYTGKGVEAALGMGWLRLLHPDDEVRTLERWTRSIATGEPYVVEHRVRRHDGTYRWFLARARPLRDARGQIRRWFGTSTDIEDMKQVEAALRAQSHLTRAITHNATTGLVVLDTRQHCTFLNPAAERIFGYTLAQMQAFDRPMHDIIHHTRPDGTPYPLAECPITRALPSRAQEQGEDVFVRPDGSFYPVAFTASPLLSEGRPAGTVVEVQDISARKSAEEALRRSEARLRSLFESIPQLVWTAAPNGDTNYVNPRWYAYTGIPQRRLRPEEFCQAIHPDDLAQLRPYWQEAIAAGRPWEAEYRLRAADGSYRWHLGRATPVHDEAGHLLKWFGSATDIDDAKRRREAQRFLAEASALLGASLDYEATLQQVARLAVPRLADWCAVDLLEEDGRIRRLAVAHSDPSKVRHAWELEERYPIKPDAPYGLPKVLRTGAPEWLADIPDEFLVESSRGDAELLRISRELGLRSYIAVPLVARGRIFGAISLVYAESERRYTEADVQFAADVGRRAALAVDNARLYRDAQTAIQLRDEFLSVASHELKTPLTPLHLKLQGLRREAESAERVPRERVLHSLEGAEVQVRRLRDLIDDLLDVSRLSQGRLSMTLEQVDLDDVVRRVVSELSPQAVKAGCALTVDADGPVPGHWDRLRLEQLVTNLLTNALKYGAGKPVALHLERAGPLARLTVRDEGIGIEAEHLGRIFGKFERAVSERHYGGLGLGLYITRQIVEAFGGRIGVESQPGQGALFTVELPLQPR